MEQMSACMARGLLLAPCNLCFRVPRAPELMRDLCSSISPSQGSRLKCQCSDTRGFEEGRKKQITLEDTAPFLRRLWEVELHLNVSREMNSFFFFVRLLYRVRQANLLFYITMPIKKRKLACRTLYLHIYIYIHHIHIFHIKERKELFKLPEYSSRLYLFRKLTLNLNLQSFPSVDREGI
jgi:hypothetical protein